MHDTATLEAFQQRLAARLAILRQSATLPPAEISRLMADLQPRLERFHQTAVQIVSEIIRPRVQALAARFPNADLGNGQHSNHCRAWFGYCDRFPVGARIEFAVEHDEQVEHLRIEYELGITPAYFPYFSHDKLVLRLNQFEEEQVPTWVEERLFGFLSDYARLDRGDDSLDDEIITDPVCGMRLPRGAAIGQQEYRGHLYFFCAAACQQHFSEEPGRYVSLDA